MIQSHPYENLLQRVKKPLRYLGGEPGSIVKPLEYLENSIVLAFPDTYEIGMSHLGFRILYEKINQTQEFGAERAFAPWIDMEQEIRKNNLPLITLETGRKLSDFPIIGFSLQFELNYTNILLMLDIGGVPLLRADRSESDPLIIAGGPVATHAEPLSDFIDLFFLGDGEELVLWFLEEEARMKNEGMSRDQRIMAFASHPSIYVPFVMKTRIDEVSGVKVVTEESIEKYGKKYPAKVESFDNEPSSAEGPVPHFSIFERAAVEISRGCNQGCRFCQAGYIYRPFRKKSPAKIVSESITAMDTMGYQEVSMTSLSSLDYPLFERLLKIVGSEVAKRNGSVAVSSMRAYDIPESLLLALRTGRGGGLTFAPEAGTQRLRDVINKNITEEGLFQTVGKVAALGWSRIKLYFMLGLPTETEDDLDAITELGHRIFYEGKKFAPSKPPQITVSVSNFVPKPHTPFQWLEFTPLDKLKEKQSFIYNSSKKRRVSVKFHSPKESYLEAILSRGDRSIGKVILDAYNSGARFDGWRDFFNLDLWLESFKKYNIDPEIFITKRKPSDRLPWDHITTGVETDFLIQEYNKALSEVVTSPCLVTEGKKVVCHVCGAKCDLPYERKIDENIEAELSELEKKYLSKDDSSLTLDSESTYRLLIKYKKIGMGVHITHLDLLDQFPRLFRASSIRAKYSKGFSPRPKMSYSPPPGRLVESYGELLEVYVHEMPEDLNLVLEKLNISSSPFILFSDIEVIDNNAKPLSERIDKVLYSLKIDAEDVDIKPIQKNIAKLMALSDLEIVRMRKGKQRSFNGRKHLHHCEAIVENEKVTINFSLDVVQEATIKPIELIELIIPSNYQENIRVIRDGFLLV